MNLNRPDGYTPLGSPPRLPLGQQPASAAAAPPALDQPDGTSSRRRPGSPLPDVRSDVPITLRDQDRLDEQGMSALHHAIWDNNRKAVKSLLRLGANPNLRLPDRMTPLILAIRCGHGDVVQELLAVRRLDYDAREHNGATALHHAAHAGSAPMIGLLLEAGVDRLAVRADRVNALHLAALSGHADAVSVLMEAMPDHWNDVAHNGHSALHMAAAFGGADVVRTMVAQSGFDINQLTSSGQTALQVAAFNEALPVINVLLGVRGIDVNTLKSNNKTALQIAAEFGNEDIVAALVGVAGLDANILHKGLDAALHLAVAKNHPGVLQKLLDLPGIDVNLPNRDGFTALALCAQMKGSSTAKEDAALLLLSHPDIDPNGAIVLLSTSRRVRDYFRQRAGAPATQSDLDFKMQELARWAHFMPRTGRPNRFLTSATNALLGVLLHSTRSDRPPPPVGVHHDRGTKDGVFRLTLALEQSLQFHGGYNPKARRYATWLLEMATPEPNQNVAQPNHHHNQFLIDGIVYPRSELEDMAQARGNYALHDAIAQIVQQGWQANVHLPGFLLRGRDIVARLQERDVASISLEHAVVAVNAAIDALATDATVNARLQTALFQRYPAQMQDGKPLPVTARLAMANWILQQPELDSAMLNKAWRAQLMRFGVQHVLSQTSEVNEEGLTITAPETLRLLQSTLHSQFDQPERSDFSRQLQDAVLERLHDIGSEFPLCNTGCVQRLLDAPSGIDGTLTAREPHDRAIFQEILDIGSVVTRAFDAQFQECDQGIVSGMDQKNYDILSAAVQKDILRATAIDDLVGRRGWHRPRVEAQLKKVLDAL